MPDHLPDLPGGLRAALQAFPDSHPMLTVWRNYPHVSPRDEELTYRWACHEASRWFVAFLAERAITARCVHAEDSLTPYHDNHWWVRITIPATVDSSAVDSPVGTVNVDWTARQFHNLEHPPSPAHADLPFPLVWMTGPRHPADTHPVSGRYSRVTDPAHPGTHTGNNTGTAA